MSDFQRRRPRPGDTSNIGFTEADTSSPYSESLKEERNPINWTKIGVISSILLGIVAILVTVYFNLQKDPPPNITVTPAPPKETLIVIPEKVADDLNDRIKLKNEPKVDPNVSPPKDFKLKSK